MKKKSYEQNIKVARFKVEALDEQLQFLEKARKGLERKFLELEAAVPDQDISVNAHKDGYVAYGSYAKSISKRKENLSRSLTEIDNQIHILRKSFEEAQIKLDKAESLKSRQIRDSELSRAC